MSIYFKICKDILNPFEISFQMKYKIDATKHFIQFYYNYFFNHKRELFFLKCKKKKKNFTQVVSCINNIQLYFLLNFKDNNSFFENQ